MYTRLKTLAAAAAFVICSGVFVAQAQEPEPDTIYFRGQSQQSRKGRVQEETMNELVWKPKSQAGSGYVDERRTSWRKIRGIQFGEQPEEYQKARELFRNGESLDEALELVNVIIEKKEVNRVFFIPRAQYLKADLLYKKASNEEGLRRALKAYNTAIDRHPDNRGYFNAIQRKIEIHRKLGENEKALEAATQLTEKNPRSRGQAYGPFLKAQIFEEQEKYKQAAEQYRTAMENARSRGLKLRARSGLGNNLMKSELYSEARKVYKKILDLKENIPKNRRGQYLVSAHNGLGRALYFLNYEEDPESQDTREENVRVLKDALLHFMRGVVWYNPPKSGSTTEFERSLYWVARTFSKLAKNVQNEKRKQEYKVEARRALNTLFNRYPDTSFRKQAKTVQRSL